MWTKRPLQSDFCPSPALPQVNSLSSLSPFLPPFFFFLVFSRKIFPSFIDLFLNFLFLYFFSILTRVSSLSLFF